MKKSALFAAGTTIALATAAFAQPVADLDMGTLTNGSGAVTGTLTGFVAGQVKWVKFTIPAGNMTRAAGQFLDLTTNGGTLTGGDSMIGLYNSTGARIATDDDDGPSAYSQLSFGDTSPARAAVAFTGNATANGLTRTGVDGADLPAGDYYLAVTGFGGTTFGTTAWTVTSTHTRTGDVAVRLELGTDTTPSNPTGVGTMPSFVLTGDVAHFKLQVTNGTFPTSTYANVGSGVTVNAAGIGAGTVTLFDDGLHGDGAAGDSNWGADVTVTAAAGSYTLPYSILDDQARTGTGNMPALVVAGPAPSCPPGTGAISFSGLSSSAAVGSANNSILPGASLNWTSTNPLLAIHVSGRLREVNTGTFASESRFHITFTDLTTLDLQPSTVGGYTGFSDVVNKVLTIPVGHNVNQIQSIEFFESFDDGADGLIDQTWDSICFSYDSQTSPTGVAVATPNSGLVGSSTLVTCTVTPGQGPVSSGITVTGDFTSIGAGAGVVLHDDGLNGDVAAADNIFSYNATIGAVSGGSKTLTFAIADAEARTGTASTTFNVTAAPGVFTNLGTIDCVPQNLTATLAAAEVKWYRLDVSAINNVPANFLDVYTTTTGSTLSNSDTEIGLYSDAGALIANDDDGGNGFYSSLSFGSTVARPDPDPVGPVLAGGNGTLAAGTYWLAVGAFNTTFAAGWNVTSTSTATGDVSLHLNASSAACTTPPSGVGAGGVVNGCGGNVVATVVVTPGTVPVSTGITVNLDTTALGGGVVAMLDSGTGGDAVAGDGTYSATLAIAGGADATFNLPFVVADAQVRSSNGSLTVTRSGTEVGDLPATAQTYYGSSGTTIAGTIGGGTDVDMFAICISDTANFEASVNNGGAAFDTQLFLFNADGTGAAMNDDEPDVAGTLQSHMMLNNSLLPTAPAIVLPSGGLYYLAISPYNRDPISSAVVTDLIWNNTATTPAGSFDATWAPNGVTPTLPVVGWTNTGNAGGAFTITMVGGSTICPADLSNSNLSASPDCAVDINDLLYFLTAFETGNADVDNGSGTGSLDCATDINDLLFFLVHFEVGC